jgi:hypothetical protein
VRNSNLKSVFTIFLRINFLHKGSLFLKKIIFYKVYPKVTRREELESEVSFLQFFWRSIFYTKDRFFLLKKIIFYKVWPKLIEDEELESAVSLINYELVIDYSLSRRKESRKHKLSAYVSALHWLVRKWCDNKRDRFP